MIRFAEINDILIVGTDTYTIVNKSVDNTAHGTVLKTITFSLVKGETMYQIILTAHNMSGGDINRSISSDVTYELLVGVEVIPINIQPELISGTNIKTINNVSLLGEGNIDTSIPYLFYNRLTTTLVGDYEAVRNAIENNKPYNIYLKYTANDYVFSANQVQLNTSNIICQFLVLSTVTGNKFVYTSYQLIIKSDLTINLVLKTIDLVSANFTKTINNQSLIGTGNIDVQYNLPQAGIVDTDDPEILGSLSDVFEAVYGNESTGFVYLYDRGTSEGDGITLAYKVMGQENDDDERFLYAYFNVNGIIKKYTINVDTGIFTSEEIDVYTNS